MSLLSPTTTATERGVERQRSSEGSWQYQPAAGPVSALAAQIPCRYFPETGFHACGRFPTYWETCGGLAIFGYPLTDECVDPTPGLVPQWFERVWFEWHPGKFPQRLDVLLGLLGRELTAERSDAPFQPARPISSCRCFPETGHNVCGGGGFRASWESFGGGRLWRPDLGGVHPSRCGHRLPPCGAALRAAPAGMTTWHLAEAVRCPARSTRRAAPSACLRSGATVSGGR